MSNLIKIDEIILRRVTNGQPVARNDDKISELHKALSNISLLSDFESLKLLVNIYSWNL